MPPLALVALGGALGAGARHLLGLLLPGAAGTLAANLLGCLLLGLLVARAGSHPVLRPLLGTGVLGGFTTFSALALGADRMLAESPLRGLGYLALTTAGGLLLLAAGLRLGRRP